MAKFTQAQCDALTRLETEKRYEADGETFIDFWVRATDENGNYCEWADTTSASGSSNSTRKTAAHTHLKEDCEFLDAPVSTQDDSISIL